MVQWLTGGLGSIIFGNHKILEAEQRGSKLQNQQVNQRAGLKLFSIYEL
jgi:hypothetical protein